jgi:hypothetical protein
MPQSQTAYRVRLAAGSLAVAGILFVLYPALRPFSDETSLQGAETFASAAWVVAHVLAMLAFILLTLALWGLHLLLQETAVERLAFWAMVITWIAIGLTLPFYGAEAFGLHAIGQAAVRQGSAALLTLANDIRTGPGLGLFLIGLILLGVGAIVAAVTVWRSRVLPRWSGIPFALGFALYIPQFFGTQPIRVAHGLLVAVGCLWIAAGMWLRSDKGVIHVPSGTTAVR